MIMNTPIFDFVKEYNEKKACRFHMPGHKGKQTLGPEPFDITEICGADVLYNAKGIIKESEANASRLFGSGKTVYSTEGSSLAIRAMVFLSGIYAQKMGKKPLILAFRNAHKTFVSAAAMMDAQVEWIFSKDNSLLSCRPDLGTIEKMIAEKSPAALYVTSPDYPGNIADIEGLATLCKKYNVLFVVDNAHGAYLKFLKKSMHPLDLGVDICCDSAHKTLPVLTGGAYLHLSKNAPEFLFDYVERAMSNFASTSPSYLILQSLDKVNKYLEKGFSEDVEEVSKMVGEMKMRLEECGYSFFGDEPLKMTILGKDYGYMGLDLAKLLEQDNIICEFADPDFVVMMFSSNTGKKELKLLEKALTSIPRKDKVKSVSPQLEEPKRVMPIRRAMLSESEKVSVNDAKGRILADLSINCPPAVPVLVCGEEVSESAIECFEYYGIEECLVVK